MGGLAAPILAAEAFFAGEQPTLRGEELALRPWRDEDAPAVAGAFADPALQHWMIESIDAGEAADWVRERRGRWVHRTGADWAVVDAQDETRLLGRVGLIRFAFDQGTGEVAYWVAAPARGRRVTPRALAVLCAWAFTAKSMHRLELKHSVSNPASCGVAHSAGFTLEGTHRAQLLHDDGWHDMHMHARLADD